MATLFEIDKSIQACWDEETGEVLDVDRLNELMMEREQKCENIACFIKNLESDLTGLVNERDRFNERIKASKHKIEQLKNYLTIALDGQKFVSAKCQVGFRPSESVEIVDDTQIPKKYMKKKISFEPDKIAIKTALKTGLKVKGCQLISKLNPQIK